MQENCFTRIIPGLEYYLDAECRLPRYRKLTQRAVPLFLRGQDSISDNPMVRGMHEFDVESIIGWAAESGFSEFLIDIGANIGLTCCLAGASFQHVICFEPNPLAFKILEVNTSIALNSFSVSLINEGLGVADGMLNLYIPKLNWGGAFVLNGNRYQEDVLAEKDGNKSFEEANYHIATVKIAEANSKLTEVFDTLRKKGVKRGVIKIDAEGFEHVIVSSLAQCLPEDFQVWIIFENHDENYDVEAVRRLFHRKTSLWKAEAERLRGAKFLRWLKAFLGKNVTYRLIPLAKAKSNIGNLVLCIE